MSKTINQALAALITGLGESSSVLADNSTISDYIGDLEDAIKKCAAGEAGDIIDDSAASETKTYSSSKIESLTAAELPAVSAIDNGKTLKVDNGAWSKGYAITVRSFNVTVNDSTKAVTLTSGNRDELDDAFTNPDRYALTLSLSTGLISWACKLMPCAYDTAESIVSFRGVLYKDSKYYDVILVLGMSGTSKDKFIMNEITES